MSKLKNWLLLRFLPAWAKESVYRENGELRRRNSELKAEIARLNAYIDGLEYGMKRRITINSGVNK